MFTRSLVALATLAAGASTHATTLTYTDWTYNTGDEIDWQVTIEETTYDDGGGAQDIFLFNVSIGEQDLIGDIIGFGFNTSIDYGDSILDGDLISFADDPAFGACSGSCNWNGTAARNLDYSFSVGSNGLRGGSDDYQAFSFGLLTLGNDLALDTFSLVAIRSTSVGFGEDREESVKDFSLTPWVEEVP